MRQSDRQFIKDLYDFERSDDVFRAGDTFEGAVKYVEDLAQKGFMEKPTKHFGGEVDF